MGPIVKSRLTKLTVKVLLPLKLDTSIGCLMIFSRGTPVASRVDKEMMLIEEPGSSIALLSSTHSCSLLYKVVNCEWLGGHAGRYFKTRPHHC